jgi:hypothetical protein
MANVAPDLPLQVGISHVLSQDVVTTATVPLDTKSDTPLGVFTNPAHGLPEALIVASLDDAGPVPAHVARDPNTEGGWSLVTPFGTHQATEVAAATAYPGTSSAVVVGFFSEQDGTLYASTLATDDATWSAPVAVGDKPVSNLRITRSPAGRLLLYGRSGGDLVTAYQERIGGVFEMSVCSFDGGLASGDFRLVMTSETDWTLAARVDDKPQLASGVLGADEPSSISALDGYAGTLKQVAVGHYSVMRKATVFLLVDDDDTMHTWAVGSDTPVVAPVPQLKVQSATGHVSSEDQTLHIYTVDDQLQLWVYHQDPVAPWNDDGTPNWARPIPIDSAVSGAESSADAAEAPSLFAVGAAEGTLRLHVQDAATGMWRASEVRRTHDGAFEVARYRTEVTLTDANGAPLPNLPVTLAVAKEGSACEVSSAGSAITLTSAPTSLTTDAMGKLTIAALTTAGLSIPDLTLAAEGLPAPATVRPAEGVLCYLSGKGALNPSNPGGPLPPFDAQGTALAKATVPGQPPGTLLAPRAASDAGLAAVVASGIQRTAQAGLSTLPPDIAGYHMRVGPNPGFTDLRSAEDLRLARAELVGPAGSVWSDIEHFFGDVWAGIVNGVIALGEIVVDAVNKLAHVTLQIGDEIAKGIALAVDGIERCAHFVAGCFAAVEAFIERVIDWLKALFDFEAIWNTKMAFEQAILALPAAIKDVLEQWQHTADDFFARMKSTMHTDFEQVIASMDGQRFDDLPAFQSTFQRNGANVAGGAAVADITGNVHHNWLQDKVFACTPHDVTLDQPGGISDAWQAFATNLEDAGQDFEGAMVNAAEALDSLIKHPDTFGSVQVAELLRAAEGLGDTALDLADSAADLFVALGEDVLDAATDVLTAEIDLGPINTLWAWLAEAAGHPDDDTLSLCSLAALVGAFPTTVVYKLVEGVDTEPFPDGVWMKIDRNALAGDLAAMPQGAAALPVMPQGCMLAGGLLQCFYSAPVFALDVLGDKAPGKLIAFTALMSLTIVALRNGPVLGIILAVGASTALAAGVLLVILLALRVIAPLTFALSGLDLWAAAGDIFAVIFTLVGLFSVGYAIYQVANHELDQLLAAGAFLVAIPGVLSFLDLRAIRNSEVGPYTTGFKIIADFGCYVAGGICQSKDAAGKLEALA